MNRVIKGTLTVEEGRGLVSFQDENGKCVLRLGGLRKPVPAKLVIELDQSPRRRLSSSDKDKIIEMAREKTSVLIIARTLNLDGRKVSGIVGNARMRGILPPKGPKEWSPRNQYPRIRKHWDHQTGD